MSFNQENKLKLENTHQKEIRLQRNRENKYYQYQNETEEDRTDRMIQAKSARAYAKRFDRILIKEAIKIAEDRAKKQRIKKCEKTQIDKSKKYWEIRDNNML